MINHSKIEECSDIEIVGFKPGHIAVRFTQDGSVQTRIYSIEDLLVTFKREPKQILSDKWRNK